MDVAAGGEVHDRVGAPADRPDQLLDLFGSARRHGRVADIGVDLDQEIAADRHRLQLGVVDVRGDDGAAARDLLADEFRRDEFRHVGAEALAIGMALPRALQHGGAAEILAMGDIDHLGGDDAGLGELVLSRHLAGLRLQDRALGRAGRHELLGGDVAVIGGGDSTAGDLLEAACVEPGATRLDEAGIEIDLRVGLGEGAGGVVEAHRRLGIGRQHDLAEGHAHLGMLGRGDIDLARADDRPGRDALGSGLDAVLLGFGVGIHRGISSLVQVRRSGVEAVQAL